MDLTRYKKTYNARFGRLTHREPFGGRGCLEWSAEARDQLIPSGTAGWGSDGDPYPQRLLKNNNNNRTQINRKTGSRTNKAISFRVKDFASLIIASITHFLTLQPQGSFCLVFVCLFLNCYKLHVFIQEILKKRKKLIYNRKSEGDNGKWLL